MTEIRALRSALATKAGIPVSNAELEAEPVGREPGGGALPPPQLPASSEEAQAALRARAAELEAIEPEARMI